MFYYLNGEKKGKINEETPNHMRGEVIILLNMLFIYNYQMHIIPKYQT